MSNIVELLNENVATRPHAPALTQRRRGRSVTVSYAQLHQRVGAEASRYIRSGLQPGDRVLVFCPVSIALYVAVLALLRCGMTAVFLDPGSGPRRLDACCKSAKPKAVIAVPRAWLLRPLVSSLRWGPMWLSASHRRRASPAPHQPLNEPVAVDADHPALLSFTSGSTGEPRGVVRTHRFLASQQQAVARDLELVAGQTSLSTMPVFVLAHLAAGVHSILTDVNLRRLNAADTRRLAETVTSQRPDRVLTSPAVLDRLAQHCQTHHIRLDTLRRVDTGGAPVFPRTLDRLRDTMPHARLIVVYGSTEAEPIAVRDATQEDVAVRQRISRGTGLPAGQFAPDLEVRLLSTSWGATAEPVRANDFHASCLGKEDIGEIIVRGGRIIRGYLDGVGDQQTKIHVDGELWHRTGDLGRFDASGQLWLLGRVAARVHDTRGTLEPLAVEAAAMEHAAVHRCALIAIAGQRVLVVELVRGATDSWRDALLEQLAWAQLDRVMTVRRIPIDQRHHAKIDYPALRRLVKANASQPSDTMRTVPAAPSISTTSPS